MRWGDLFKKGLTQKLISPFLKRRLSVIVKFLKRDGPVTPNNAQKRERTD